MNTRPLSVTLIGCLFIVAGVIGLAYHATEFNARAIDYGLIWVLCLRLLAVVGGIFMLRRRNWARWLLLLWMSYHVILSAFHSASELITHSVLLAAIAYWLLRPRTSAYFRGAQ
jgi:hypothetical protein